MLVRPHGRSHIGLIHRFIEPSFQRDRLAVLLRFAGRERFVGIGERISETVHGNAAGDAHISDTGRDGIRQHILHVFLRRDGHIFRCLHDIGCAEIRIRLRAEDAHIDGRADGDAAGNRRAVHAAHPFRHFMRRIQRDIALLRADFHIAFRVRFRDGVQIIHIHRAGDPDARSAAALDGNVRPILGILRRK